MMSIICFVIQASFSSLPLFLYQKTNLFDYRVFDPAWKAIHIGPWLYNYWKET